MDGVQLTGLIDARKDVDGLTPDERRPARARPRRPAPVHAAGLHGPARGGRASTLEGAEAVVIGRSNLFGKPMAQLLLQANATVTTCHSRTRDLPAVARRADVLIAATGRPKMVGGDWVKPGAAVIDVGINRTDDGLVGDVDFDAAAEVAARDHARAGRRRPDDDRVPAAQHAAGRAPAGRGAVSLRRLRSGELLAGAGAVALFIVLFLDWFEPEVQPRRRDVGPRRRARAAPQRLDVARLADDRRCCWS